MTVSPTARSRTIGRAVFCGRYPVRSWRRCSRGPGQTWMRDMRVVAARRMHGPAAVGSSGARRYWRRLGAT